jgi:uncharacterized protein
MADLVVGDIRVAPGEKIERVVEVPVGTRTVPVPVVAINGRQDGPRISITGGMHGGEYVGIETARRLGKQLDPEQVSGSVVIVVTCNVTAFQGRSVYLSELDGHNLNRMFPGNPEGEPSERLAYWLFENVIRSSQYHIDLHGGDLTEALAPFTLYLRSDNQEVEETSRRMAIAMGIDCIIRVDVPGAAYSVATELGIPSILPEAGDQGKWDDETVGMFFDGVQGVLRYLHILPGTREIDENHRIYQDFPFMRSPMNGFWYPRVKLYDKVKKGDLMGTVTDYFGNERHRIEAPVDGEVIVVVTGLATNEGEVVAGLAV